jgi:exopolysaccharide production protein ExoZ
MAIAMLFLSGKLNLLGSAVGIVMVIAGFVAIFALDPFFTTSNRAFVYGIPAAVIVIGVLAFESRSRTLRMPFLQFTGDASYSIYLVHIFPVAVLRAFWPLPMEGAASFVLFLLVSVASTIALGAVSYYAVERTSLKYLRRMIARYLPA